MAESGHGGGHCAPDGTCVGLTGKISWHQLPRHHESEPVVRHLGSVSDKTGAFALGPAGVSASEGRIYGTVSLARDFVPHGAFPAWLESGLKKTLGHLIVARPNGWSGSVADVGHHDFVWTGNHPNLVPGQFPDAATVRRVRRERPHAVGGRCRCEHDRPGQERPRAGRQVHPEPAGGERG